jgi:hypothetical protein
LGRGNSPWPSGNCAPTSLTPGGVQKDLAPPDPFLVPTFCRHNRLIQNCQICSREQSIEVRPLISSSAPKSSERAPRPASGSTSRSASGRGGSGPGSRSRSGVTVRRLHESVDDGYRSALVPGLRSTADAQRLAEDLALAAARVARLRTDPPGLYATVADPAGDLEERTWLAFLIAYLGPLEGAEDPFEAIRAVGTPWSSGELPDLEGVQTGPRTAHEPARGQATLRAYRQWAERAGSQALAFSGESGWSADRRFARVFERLALPGLHRAARFELLTSLGALELYELQAGALALGGSDAVTVSAKRAFGIGDPLLLERRAAQLAGAGEAPLEALDLALFNWGGGGRISLGVPVEPSRAVLQATADALGVEISSGDD